MLRRLLLLGATGDLAGRLLLPALARLVSEGRVPRDLAVVGAAPGDLDDDALARHVAGRLGEHAADVPAADRAALVARVRSARLDLDRPATVAAAVRAATDDGAAPAAVYLALPPDRFPAALSALAGAALPRGSRVVVEKPFGEDLDGALALNAQLQEVAGAPGAAYRVDHALGMPGAADLLARRAPGGDLEAVWHGGAVERVELLWEETLALEGRADFYDRAGAARDILQNHLLQLLALAAGELPPGGADGSGATDRHAARLDLLRSLHAPAGVAPDRWSSRGRYTAGTLAGGRRVPDYAAEEGVDPGRGTETHAELVLVSDAPRWAGTRFVLRSGKALAADRKGVAVHLRPGAPALAAQGPDRRVWVDLDETSATGERVAGEVTAYTRVLADVLSGGDELSVGAAESEQAWRVVAPALEAWAAGSVPLREHPAGSAGPAPLPGA